jgi:hypothetical protein
MSSASTDNPYNVEVLAGAIAAHDLSPAAARSPTVRAASAVLFAACTSARDSVRRSQA